MQQVSQHSDNAQPRDTEGSILQIKASKASFQGCVCLPLPTMQQSLQAEILPCLKVMSNGIDTCRLGSPKLSRGLPGR